MKVKQTTVMRFQEIIAQRKIRPSELANISGVMPSTVHSMLDDRRKEFNINTIKKLCDGLEISLGEFLIRSCLIIWNRKLSKYRRHNKKIWAWAGA